MFSRFKILIFQNEATRHSIPTPFKKLYFYWTLITCSCIVFLGLGTLVCCSLFCPVLFCGAISQNAVSYFPSFTLLVLQQSILKQRPQKEILWYIHNVLRNLLFLSLSKVQPTSVTTHAHRVGGGGKEALQYKIDRGDCRTMYTQ